jgi:hypothetical protein
LTPNQKRALRNARKSHGLLGPGPHFQGDLIAISHKEWEEIKDLMHPYQLPVPIEGDFTYEDDTGFHILNSDKIPYIVSHRWFLKSLKWVQERFGPFEQKV